MIYKWAIIRYLNSMKIRKVRILVFRSREQVSIETVLSILKTLFTNITKQSELLAKDAVESLN